MEFHHISVLFEETLEGLHIRPEGIYVDGTMGGAGHGQGIAERLSAGGRYIGIDQDEAAIFAGRERLLPYGDRATVVRSNYEAMASIVHGLGIQKVDGILLDLGVSSYQLDTPERGFSYREDAPLDMRMDQRQQTTARDIVNGCGETELFHLIRDYGEDPFARNIARHIVKERAQRPIETTGQLAQAISRGIPARARAAGGHPAKRTFQAIRIALNRELTVLSDSLDDMIDLLNPGGRICIITFHSLEDRIVKNTFRKSENPCTCPPNFPVCVCGKAPKGRVITKKPILPGEEELAINKRAKSAKLRIFERA